MVTLSRVTPKGQFGSKISVMTGRNNTVPKTIRVPIILYLHFNPFNFCLKMPCQFQEISPDSCQEPFAGVTGFLNEAMIIANTTLTM